MTNIRHLFLASYGAECYRHSFQTFRPYFLSRYTVCTRLHNFKSKNAKAPYRGSGDTPLPHPPPRSLRSLGLGRFTPRNISCSVFWLSNVGKYVVCVYIHVIYAILSPHAMKISYFSFSQSSCRSTCSPPKGIMVQVLSCHHFKSQTVVSPSHEPVVVFAGGNHLFVATSQHSIEVYLLDGAKCTLVNTVKTVGIAWNGTFSIKGML